MKLICPKEHFTKYQTIDNVPDLRKYLQNYVDHYLEDILVYDTETTGLRLNNELLGVGFYHIHALPVFVHTNTYFSTGLTISELRQVMAEFMPRIRKGVGHNAKYDETVFLKNDFCIPHLYRDTMAMIHAYSPDLERGLETRVLKDYGYAKKSFTEIVGVAKKAWDQIKWSDKILPLLGAYCGEDVVWEAEMFYFYEPKVTKDHLDRLVDEIEVPIVPVLRDMWLRGVMIDAQVLYDMDERMDPEIVATMDNIYLEAGEVFNINSGPQKAKILYDVLKLPMYKKTKAGGRSTDGHVLEALAAEGHRIAAYMCDYSELKTLRQSFIQAIPRKLDEDGALRCNFNSCGTRTGRFSADNPNLQNQPNNKRFPVRTAFVPRPGYKFVCLDYSQIELRVMAHVSKDKRFMDAFLTGEDIHAAVGRDLGITRDQGKTTNFAVLYGVGPDKLAGMLGTTVAGAKKVLRDYEKTYTGFYNWKVKTEENLSRYGIVKNPFGRIRRLPGALSDNPKLHYGALRQGINTICQGGAADLIKKAMIQIHKRFIAEDLDAYLLLQVHDELLIEVRTDQACYVHDLVKHIMENTTKLIVPLEADGKVISNWGMMKDKDYQSEYELIKSGDYVETIKSKSIPTWMHSLRRN